MIEQYTMRRRRSRPTRPVIAGRGRRNRRRDRPAPAMGGCDRRPAAPRALLRADSPTQQLSRRASRDAGHARVPRRRQRARRVPRPRRRRRRHRPRDRRPARRDRGALVQRLGRRASGSRASASARSAAQKDGERFEITTFRAEVYRARQPQARGRRSPTTSRPTSRGATSRSTRWRSRSPDAASSSTRSTALADLAARPAAHAARAGDLVRRRPAAHAARGAVRRDARLRARPDAGRTRSSSMRDRLEIVSAERIRDELVEAAASSTTRRPGCGSSRARGLADEFLPELNAMELEQDPIHRHKDVLAHTIAVVAKTSPRPAAAARRAAARRRQAQDARRSGRRA